MTTRERITSDLTTAMKARNAPAVSALRMLTSAIKNVEIDGMKKLTDQDVENVIAREVKKLRDSLVSFVAGGREDLAEAARAEITLVSAYLPAQMDDAALAELVKAKMAELGPLTEKDFGRLMKEVMAASKGMADGAKVSKAVKEALTVKPA